MNLRPNQIIKKNSKTLILLELNLIISIKGMLLNKVMKIIHQKGNSNYHLILLNLCHMQISKNQI
jgi:hypothetical protein